MKADPPTFVEIAPAKRAASRDSATFGMKTVEAQAPSVSQSRTFLEISAAETGTFCNSASLGAQTVRPRALTVPSTTPHPRMVVLDRGLAPHQQLSQRELQENKARLGEVDEQEIKARLGEVGKQEIKVRLGEVGEQEIKVRLGEVDEQEDDEQLVGRRRPAAKNTYKKRGSLLDKLEPQTIQTKWRRNRPQEMQVLNQSKEHNISQREKKKFHKFTPKNVSRDIHIPSLVSVGALSQLLNVKLCTCYYHLTNSFSLLRSLPSEAHEKSWHVGRNLV
jgi:hypothetical protein